MRKRHNVKNQIEDESTKKKTEKRKKNPTYIGMTMSIYFCIKNERKKMERIKFSIDLPFMRLFCTS